MAHMKVYFFDTETTGNMPTDRLCQLAIKERGIDEPLINEYFNPGMPIPFEASAVHHITNKMVAGKPLFKDAKDYQTVKELFESADAYVVAHNAGFDVGMLRAEGIEPTHVICTLKVLRALDGKKEFANHKLQYLRYALDMDINVPAHDAYADVIVLEKLFEYLVDRLMKENALSEEAVYAKMEEISSQPSILSDFGFGKHKGKSVAEVAQSDPGYLSWLLAEKEKNPSGEEDWIYTLKKHLGLVQ